MLYQYISGCWNLVPIKFYAVENRKHKTLFFKSCGYIMLKFHENIKVKKLNTRIINIVTLTCFQTRGLKQRQMMRKNKLKIMWDFSFFLTVLSFVRTLLRKVLNNIFMVLTQTSKGFCLSRIHGKLFCVFFISFPLLVLSFSFYIREHFTSYRFKHRLFINTDTKFNSKFLL